ncbi:MAG: DUF5121 domain-containing protein [Alistipes sp.]|nr:DUF5121 domain-containing protein [Alistipes sp.]
MKILKYIALPLLAIATMVGCQKDPELQITDKGPQMTVESVSTEAYFGSNISFEVTMNDVLPLSTLKAQLFFDDEMVGETVIRTKTNGTYSGTVLVPFAANIPDGPAKLALVGQNIQFGLTRIEQQVAVSRPQPEKIYLVMGEEKLEMARQEGYLYSVTADFPQKPKGYFCTDALDAEGTIATFGWKNGSVVWDSTSEIPFSNAVAGEYAITFDMLSFEAAPFLKLMFGGKELGLAEGSDSQYIAVMALSKGKTYAFEGLDISSWTVDTDWFTRNEDGSLAANVIDGTYKVIVDTNAEYITAMTCDANGVAAMFDTATGNGALYLVGEGLGKPNMAGAPGWVPEKGLCLAPVAANTHQITATAGLNMQADKINFKFFGQNNGWGPVELKGDILSCTSDLILVGQGVDGYDSGNVYLQEGKTFEPGGIYKFTLVWNGGTGTFSVEKIGQTELPKEDLAINGQTLEQIDASNYAGVFALNQGDVLVPTGFGDMSAWWADTNYVNATASGLKFKPVSGNYKIMVNTDAKTVFFKRVNADGTDATLADDGTGAIWLMGWGVGAPSLDNQLGWDAGKAYCMPEVAPGIYEFIGYAGPEKGSVIGQYFRYDYISMKYFHQNNWGGEMKLSGDEKNTTLNSLLLKDAGNLELADGVQLENGTEKAYILRIDATAGKNNVILSFEEYIEEGMAINGKLLNMVDASNYEGIYEFKQGDMLIPAGFGNLASWWVDTNYVKATAAGLQFLPVDGTYKVMVNIDKSTVHFKRVNADGSDATFADDGTGAIWLMGWGVGAPSQDFQFGFEPGKAYCMPEIQKGVYVMTGYAGPEEESSYGDYFRADYISMKYFHQNGWGGEMKLSGDEKNTTLDSALLKDSGNLELADGVQLEDGSIYQLIIDASAGKGNVVVKFTKM